ncbi:MAG: DUF354 domain-containing protein, partial [Saprospiraceae bacterium]|nr:DUF354 domain-containing protein [Saprospiraceae bacterium]
HLPQFNFLKNAILTFDPSEVDIFCVNRGKLFTVMQFELPGYQIISLGDYRHNKGKWSMLFKIILPRMLKLYRLVTRRKYAFVITAHYQSNVIAKLRGIPNISLIDDPRKIVFPILKWAANTVYLPPFGPRFKGVRVFNALKEWAYLSPSYFQANKFALQTHNLIPKNYIFIREVSTMTSNYLSQQEDIILSIAPSFPQDWKIVLSLEKKENVSKYPPHWIVLEEPVEDIHSIMYFSRLVISSGDSMAREGAMLGVPSIYAGNRFMPANEILITKNMLYKVNPDEVVECVTTLLSSSHQQESQESVRDQLTSEWDDVTALILSKLRMIEIS